MSTFIHLKFRGDDWETVVAYWTLLQRLLNLMFRNSDLSELTYKPWVRQPSMSESILLIWSRSEGEWRICPEIVLFLRLSQRRILSAM